MAEGASWDSIMDPAEETLYPYSSFRGLNLCVPTMCRYFLQGRCRYGDNCWNLHFQRDPQVRPRKEKPANTTSAAAGLQVSENWDSTQPNGANRREPPGVRQRNPGNSSRHGRSNTLRQNNSVQAWPDESPPKASGKRNNGKPKILCKFFLEGECRSRPCRFVHGTPCDICNRHCLIPNDKEQNKAHKEECKANTERELQLALAFERSMTMSCGICMDVIMEKEVATEQRFGILEKCNHVFCLECIRKWRRVKSFDRTREVEESVDPNVTRACPECRVRSDFVLPSDRWPDTEEEKTRLIQNYKSKLSRRPCKYFKEGRGHCRFGNTCFYLHAMPDGTRVELPPPQERRPRHIFRIGDDWESYWSSSDDEAIYDFDLEHIMDIIYNLDGQHPSDDEWYNEI